MFTQYTVQDSCVILYLSVCLSAWLVACLSACLLICLSDWLTGYLSACLSVCLLVSLSVCLPAGLSACLPIYLSIHLFVRYSVCLSVGRSLFNIFYTVVHVYLLSSLGSNKEPSWSFCSRSSRCFKSSSFVLSREWILSSTLVGFRASVSNTKCFFKLENPCKEKTVKRPG